MALTLRQLQIIEYQLTDRDREILKLLRDTKSMFTYQIRRVCFSDSVNEKAAARAANRNLRKLKDLGLIDALVDRRIGGVRAGSSSYIWYLTEQGNKLLDMDKESSDEKKPKRNRFYEPADSTLGHRMAIVECFVQLVEITRKRKSFKLKEVFFEPSNWQYFTYKDKPEILKPDLTISLSHHGYEYRFFIEMDLGTESIDTVISKCIRYHKYMKSGVEQDKHGVFPYVLWIVKDEKRQNKLETAIKTHLKKHPNIFIVIPAVELESIITARDIPEDKLC